MKKDFVVAGVPIEKAVSEAAPFCHSIPLTAANRPFKSTISADLSEQLAGA
jgi:hypothetical protein